MLYINYIERELCMHKSNKFYKENKIEKKNEKRE